MTIGKKVGGKKECQWTTCICTIGISSRHVSLVWPSGNHRSYWVKASLPCCPLSKGIPGRKCMWSCMVGTIKEWTYWSRTSGQYEAGRLHEALLGAREGSAFGWPLHQGQWGQPVLTRAARTSTRSSLPVARSLRRKMFSLEEQSSPSSTFHVPQADT